MKKILISFVVASLTMTIAACQSKSTLGGAVGGIAGGVAGSNIGGGSGRTAAIIAGSLLGAALGSHIGGEMDELDRRRANDTLETYPTGRTSSWNNPDTGARYNVTPTRTYQANQQPCREYEMDVYMDGQRDVVTGTACRNNQGEWINQ
ncbi:17 kDa surface antigen [Methylophaga frappieri]|uniref:17 kDa surface antigen n=1 Tax=Methylophaga frappieri (strain ATCC BAA-2434 / DSM 25690 / JAM7) TaxID=754477 RepID=I1YL79_METFJ|nr:RT0821/Lpp0805 family surface protein [Methylophaga frappieri]AFJ03672.1 17 kDa surface antigen [Methylophaga frappieri]